MTIDLQQLVKLGIIPKADDEIVIDHGVLVSNQGTDDPYDISFGWSCVNALTCDQSWREYRVRVLEHIKDNCNEEETQDWLSKIQTEDYHWQWISKSMQYDTDEYKWFFLKTKENIEAACLIYFPKKSALNDNDIFYVEFIAVAPWNRFSPLEKKRYNSIGKKLLQEIIKYSTSTLGYQYAFCLHSLPQAQGFYEYIGMVHIDKLDKRPLQYYEIDNDQSMKFVGLV
ncbi:TPA: hypothetical protein ACVH97_003535 [Yersinia enterocolitica]|uniref:hypothetical protein n=1 Tax=Yersinia enterocolitica TaxID=630 RepID=UPI002875D397|nr:N-acetyltransferase [Yersinia enterocolitica]EKN6283971.1 N-acetyltransferase [Yersinia enterocolitica]ELY5202784.1 hypothetical protein [Yersinia enterocolitica]ELY5241947.1 hypothetical protein [Yersinia enterocolitica]HDM8367449.1 hypothetical protein [Yersinia enterocolitica]